MVSGWGLIDSHNTMSLPQSVIDNEMAAMLHRLRRPVEVSDATLAGDAVDRGGPGGSFLGRQGHRDDASAPASTSCRRSRTGCRTRSGRRTTSPSYDDACEQVELSSPRTRPRHPTSTTRSSTRSPPSAAPTTRRSPRPARLTRAARHQEAPERRTHDAQDRLHRARRPRQAPRRQPAEGRIPAAPCTTSTGRAPSTWRGTAPSAPTPSLEMAQASDTVITCLPSPEAVIRGRRRRGGVFEGSPPAAPGSR